jgi:hypothetical protein
LRWPVTLATSAVWSKPEVTAHRRDVCFAPDIVAKVPKGRAVNFPPNNETSNNRRSIGLQTRYQNRLCVLRLATWSPASLFNRCTYGPENLSPTSQKDFCNNIPRSADIVKHGCDAVVLGGRCNNAFGSDLRGRPKCSIDGGTANAQGLCDLRRSFAACLQLAHLCGIDRSWPAFVNTS